MNPGNNLIVGLMKEGGGYNTGVNDPDGKFGESYGTSYYPGTRDPTAASIIEVGAGLTLEGINLTLRPTKVANIRGRVMNPGNNLIVGLMKEGGGYNTGVNDPDGKFELQGVSPGSYILTAASTVGGRNCSARLPI